MFPMQNVIEMVRIFNGFDYCRQQLRKKNPAQYKKENSFEKKIKLQ